MARYWVGGTGNTSDTAHWAASSGGAGGQTVPDSTQDVYFDGNSHSSGSFVVTVNSNLACRNFTVSGLGQSMTLAGGAELQPAGSFYLQPTNLTWTKTSSVRFNAVSSAHTIDAGGHTITGSVYLLGASADWALASALVLTGSIQHFSSDFDTNGHAISCTHYQGDGGTINLRNSVLTITGTGNVWEGTSRTVVQSGSEIMLSNTSTSARAFVGNGQSYGKLTIGGATGSSTLTITGANTFAELASTKTVAHTIVFPNVATTVNAWTIAGSSGNAVTMTRTGGSGSFTLKITDGYPSRTIDYLSVSNCVASPANSIWFIGANSTDGGGNSGLFFSAWKNTGAMLPYLLPTNKYS